jgi:hypothetical protein
MRRRLWKPALLFLLLGLVTTLVVATLLALLVDVRQGPQTTAERYGAAGRWTVSRWDRAGAVQIQSARTRGLDWGPEQAAGEPDTPTLGDQVTAWASQSADGSPEWLILHFENAVVPRELHVYENCAPGALVRVTAFDDAGAETEAWAGADPSPAAVGAGAAVPVSKIPLALSVPTRRVKIYLASDKVAGWNEVDAVALVDNTGTKQWARRVEASSTYASGRGPGGGVDPTVLAPAWARLDRVSREFEGLSVNRDSRVVDARGWPLLALSSELELTPGNPVPPQLTPALVSGGAITISGSSAPFGSTGTLVLTTPVAPGIRPPLPTRPIWFGLLADTLIFAAAWCILWLTLTIPRRFVCEVARVRRGACVQCGYDLGFDFIRGCPECGWRRGPADRPAADAPR